MRATAYTLGIFAALIGAGVCLDLAARAESPYVLALCALLCYVGAVFGFTRLEHETAKEAAAQPPRWEKH